MCFSTINFAYIFTIFRLDFGTVASLECLVFHFISKFQQLKLTLAYLKEHDKE